MIMKKKSFFVLGVLLLSGVVGFLFYYSANLTSGGPGHVMEVYDYEVVVATEDIASGEPLTVENTSSKRVPRQFLAENVLLTQDLSIYLNILLARDIEPGSLILTSDFSVEAQRRTATIPIGERAFLLHPEDISAIPEEVVKQDRVDIVVTISATSERPASTFLLLHNLTILDIGDDGSITLILTPHEVKTLVLALAEDHQLSLIARNRNDIDSTRPVVRFLPESTSDIDALNDQRFEELETKATQHRRQQCPGQYDKESGRCTPHPRYRENQ